MRGPRLANLFPVRTPLQFMVRRDLTNNVPRAFRIPAT
jgi:hypothetical protein